ncbi:MAG: methylated-DNA--[protein]-cysteine S-methyltransferase [Candidatus Hydrogenedentes bacterium]|nr:methylated-DNA--[protein]-cysteine S-methyltransferase [Candidatus Hydrogenedentota bacterium]
MKSQTIRFSTLETAMGSLLLAATARGLCQVQFLHGSRLRSPQPDWVQDDAALEGTRTALENYLSGTAQSFDIGLDAKGTPFQNAVWNALKQIPFGETRSYAEIAAAIGRPAAVRAVASANASNPLAIVVPCHRVIGSDGKLRGYAGGLPAKAALLAHERRVISTAGALCAGR